MEGRPVPAGAMYPVGRSIVLAAVTGVAAGLLFYPLAWMAMALGGHQCAPGGLDSLGCAIVVALFLRLALILATVLAAAGALALLPVRHGALVGLAGGLTYTVVSFNFPLWPLIGLPVCLGLGVALAAVLPFAPIRVIGVIVATAVIVAGGGGLQDAANKAAFAAQSRQAQKEVQQHLGYAVYAPDWLPDGASHPTPQLRSAPAAYSGARVVILEYKLQLPGESQYAPANRFEIQEALAPPDRPVGICSLPSQQARYACKPLLQTPAGRQVFEVDLSRTYTGYVTRLGNTIVEIGYQYLKSDSELAEVVDSLAVVPPEQVKFDSGDALFNHPAGLAPGRA